MPTVSTAHVHITSAGGKVVASELDAVVAALNNFDRVNVRISDSQRATTREVSGAAKALQGFQGALATAGLAIGAREMLQFAKSSMEMANRLEVSTVALNAMGQGAVTAAEGIAAVRAATHNTISDMEAGNVAPRLMALGYAENTEQMERFAYAAATLGKAFRNLDPTGLSACWTTSGSASERSTSAWRRWAAPAARRSRQR
jgi:hypothetical protein